MKSLLTLSLVLLALPALAANPIPVITSVTPSIGPVSGGTRVVITGTTLDESDVICVLPCPTTVVFGEVRVVPTYSSNTRLEVTTPPHAAGTVSIAVDAPGHTRTGIAPGAFTYLEPQQTVPTPVIAAVTPSSGPVSGGWTVIITGSALDVPQGFACILPCPTKVAFGESEVIPSQVSNTRLVATLPPHTPGPVTIMVKTGDGRTAIAPTTFTYLDGPEEGYEKLLLPIHTESRVAGSNGSLWETDLWLRNDSKEAITLAPWVCPPNATCPAIFPLTYTLEGGSALHNLPALSRVASANPARMLYVSRERAASLSAGLRIADVSRSGENAGTEVPVVRERDLRTAVLQLHNILLSGRFRVLLRIYDTALTEARFRVRFYAEAAGQAPQPLLDVTLTAKSDETGAFRVTPAYAQYSELSNLLLLPSIAPAALRAEIEPLTSGSTFWAFASITNNDTQHVTLVTPQ
jgi:hypothetical protein